jgi:hypothetical protein
VAKCHLVDLDTEILLVSSVYYFRTHANRTNYLLRRHRLKNVAGNRVSELSRTTAIVNTIPSLEWKAYSVTVH